MVSGQWSGGDEGTHDTGRPLEEWEVPRESRKTGHRPLSHCSLNSGNSALRDKGNRRVDRCKGGLRVSLRQALPRQQEGTVRGPFTVESLSPHRLLGVDENDSLIDSVAEGKLGYGEKQDFAATVLENLKTTGVQQAHKEDRISFSGMRPWPGNLVCAEGSYVEGETGMALKNVRVSLSGRNSGRSRALIS